MKRALLVTGFLAMVSCGDEKKDFAGSLGSCTSTMDLGVDSALTMCTDYTYVAKEEEKDPAADAKAAMELACTTSEGTFAATACESTDALGSCTFTQVAGKATVTGVSYYLTVPEGLEAADMESSCEAQSGVFAVR